MTKPIYKYPRTPHLSWSEGAIDNDRFSLADFTGKEVVVTLKMDGENTTMSKDFIHARSLDSKNHESRAWVKGFWGRIKQDIPENFRICGENLYAKHSIHYKNLASYFYGFSIFNENNFCLSWEDTLMFFDILDIFPVKEIYRGIYNEDAIKKAYEPYKIEHEGYVIRSLDKFAYKDFNNEVAKYVRPFHVTTNTHWMFDKMILNKLKDYD